MASASTGSKRRMSKATSPPDVARGRPRKRRPRRRLRTALGLWWERRVHVVVVIDDANLKKNAMSNTIKRAL